ncbi:uncharacterized protein LOC109949513 [Prunus persica]|uniref:uncharacterized protein LOC109949513 n=1 Tax=Prunus persica TaxID=3760 RepID=UPI0009ABA4B3|nr:uncharacterized protein LOC109949513 [Prunus persica]
MFVILRNNKTPKSQTPNCCLPSILVSVLWKSKRYALTVVLGILMGQRVGNGSGFGFVGGNNLVVDLNPSPYAIRPPDPRFEVGAMYETSKEVSSMPKVQPLSSGGQVVGRSASSLGFRNEDKGVEVWAVHRKESSAGGGIFMEYVESVPSGEARLRIEGNCTRIQSELGFF